MIKTDYPFLIKPDPSLEIWRYISFEKFEAMLQTNSLFFCRADRFSDPFEGSLPIREVEFRNNQHTGESGLDNILGFKKTHIGFKRANVINCWQINNNENDAMWRLYLKSTRGLAIKSNVLSLIKSFDGNSNSFNLSKVRYINYDTDVWYHPDEYPSEYYNFTTPLVHKRIEFRHETELRIFHHIEEPVNNEAYWNSQPIESGKNMVINLQELVHEIILTPTADIMVEKELQQILHKYGFDKPIKKSQLSTNPRF